MHFDSEPLMLFKHNLLRYGTAPAREKLQAECSDLVQIIS